MRREYAVCRRGYYECTLAFPHVVAAPEQEALRLTYLHTLFHSFFHFMYQVGKKVMSYF